MKNIKNKIKLVIGILLISFNLVGCSINNKEVIWKSKDELVFGTTLSTKSLDPASGYCGWFLVRYGVGETLFKLDDNMEVEPWLAESYTYIGNKKWSISIKDNINFHNGKELTLNSVKRSLERTINMNSRAEDTLKIESIEIEGESLIITTKEENPTLINDLCDPFVAIIDVDSNEDISSIPIGTGPFKVGQFNHSGISYYYRNNDYWNGEVKLNKINVITISDADTLAMALQSGEIDVAQGLSYSMVDLFKKDSNYRVSSIDTSRAIVMYFNEENKVLSDYSFRKAINLLIDKESYCNAILKMQATPGIGIFPSNTNFALEEELRESNKEEAIKILTEAGYIDSNNDGLLDKDGINLSFKLVTYSSRAELPNIAQAIQDDLKEVGIKVSIEMSDNIMDILEAKKFDLALYSNVTSATGDTLAYLNNAVRTNGASNYGSYSNGKVDELIQKLKLEFDKDKRNELAKEIQSIILEDEGYNYIAHMKMSFVMKNNVIGINPHSTDYYQFSANTDIK